MTNGKSNPKASDSKGTPMTTQAAARVQSAGAAKSDGKTPSGSFAARAQRAAARNSGRGKK